jgi:hypothetical protein
MSGKRFVPSRRVAVIENGRLFVDNSVSMNTF